MLKRQLAWLFSRWVRLRVALRRHRFLAGLRLQAAVRGVALELIVGRDLVVGAGVHVELGGRRVRLEIGDDVTLADQVRLQLVDARVHLGSGVGIKRECLIHVFGGDLDLVGYCGFSQRCIVHCAERVTLGRYSVVSEHATIVDSEHQVPLEPVHENWLRDPARVRRAPIDIGSHVFVGAKATILLGVTIGDHAVIGANSLVTRDVPARTVAIGVPARRVRRA